MIKQWTLQALSIAMREDLAACATQFERTNCQAICRVEIRETAAKIKKDRKLSPAEVAILDNLGI